VEIDWVAPWASSVAGSRSKARRVTRVTSGSCRDPLVSAAASPRAYPSRPPRRSCTIAARRCP
jgi:hypothetical protein